MFAFETACRKMFGSYSKSRLLFKNLITNYDVGKVEPVKENLVLAIDLASSHFEDSVLSTGFISIYVICHFIYCCSRERRVFFKALKL